MCNRKAKVANGNQWRFGNNEQNIGTVKEKGSTEVYKYDKDGNYICSFSTFEEGSKSVNRAPSTISRAVSTGRMSNNFFGV